MLPSLLIANRGEIACRIIRTARRLGVRTVAVHSEADRDAPHVRLADEAHAIGPAPAAESYLRIDRILEAAARSGAAAIHPGYGFLSERPDFAESCAAAGLVFVGPPASAIRAMGLKDAAKALAERAGVPVVPGYHGAEQDPDFLASRAEAIGYPVLVKAVAGGGGKGMRRVEASGDFAAALEGARREAQASFGDPRVLIERYVLSPRHVEIQVFADAHGGVVHLHERDCSLQRRHQKVIEEAPAPGMTPEMRDVMGRAAVGAARAVGYVGAGTVEFIADGREGLRPDRFYFMEMNTRLQVEHPVTEAITGLDLVELQLRVASGEPLPFGQDDLAIRGHAVEARLYAEDPAAGFLPSTGRLWALRLPDGEGVRVDAGVEEGGEVTPHYDPMIAKVIAHGPTREAALDRLSAALARTLVAGPRTNTAFLRALADAPAFREGRFDTGFIDRELARLVAPPGAEERGALAAAGAAELLRIERRGRHPGIFDGARRGGGAWRDDPWATDDAFGVMGARRQSLPLVVDGERVEATLTWSGGEGSSPEGRDVLPEIAVEGYRGTPRGVRQGSVRQGSVRQGSVRDGSVRDGGTRGRRLYEGVGEGRAEAIRAGDGVIVVRGAAQVRVAPHDPFAVDLEHLDDEGGVVKAPMHGRVVAVLVQPGDAVRRGQRLAVVEAMKMEHALVAPIDGEVAEVAAQPGAQVAEGARLVVVRAAETA